MGRLNIKLLFPALALSLLLFMGAYWKKRDQLVEYTQTIDDLTGTISTTIHNEYEALTKEDPDNKMELPASTDDNEELSAMSDPDAVDIQDALLDDMESDDNNSFDDDTQQDEVDVLDEEESTSKAGKERPSFYQIASKYKTDKVDLHHYEGIYTHLLEPIRDNSVKFLEIGLGCDSDYGPGASYKTWLDYFPKVALHFIEHNRECAEKWSHDEHGTKMYIGSQSNAKFLETVIKDSGGQFDVIVDDGGHHMDQQRTSLRTLWKALKPGGIYFIEDVQTSYMEHYGGTGGKEEGDFMFDMKTLWDDVNDPEGRKPVFDWSAEVERVEFVKECVAIVKKAGAGGKKSKGGWIW